MHSRQSTRHSVGEGPRPSFKTHQYKQYFPLFAHVSLHLNMKTHFALVGALVLLLAIASTINARTGKRFSVFYCFPCTPCNFLTVTQTHFSLLFPSCLQTLSLGASSWTTLPDIVEVVVVVVSVALLVLPRHLALAPTWEEVLVAPCLEVLAPQAAPRVVALWAKEWKDPPLAKVSGTRLIMKLCALALVVLAVVAVVVALGALGAQAPAPAPAPALVLALLVLLWALLVAPCSILATIAPMDSSMISTTTRHFRPLSTPTRQLFPLSIPSLCLLSKRSPFSSRK